MSEDRVPVGQAIAVSTADEAATEAGKPKVFSDPVKNLEDHCKTFIESSPIKAHNRSMALTKLGEMCFWIRAGYGRE